jgi:glyoxylase-like metal-dependent hydrolase (beta-lactamase superfamily II)
MPEGQLHLIDLDIVPLGYFKFISSWLYTSSEGNFLVDPGPECSIPSLLKALIEKEVDSLDWILLTHIHQDHAGGLGKLIKEFPEAKVITHEKGAPHIVNPIILLQGSRQILGHVSEVYGGITPVPQNNVKVMKEIPFGSGIKVIPTPGHASHHLCFVFEDWFFAGELFGAHIPMEEGLYLRPATPHRFVLEDYLTSMEIVEPYLKQKICFAHYNFAEDSKLILKTARDQLKLWVKIIEENKQESDYNNIINILLEKDEVFELFNLLDKEIQNREIEFSKNSIIGILKYIETN